MATVAWPRPADRSWRGMPPEARVHALVIGGCIPALAACIGYLLHIEWVAIVAGFGIVIGAALAFEGAAWMSGPDWVAGAFRAAFIAPLIAAGLLVAGGAVGALASPSSWTPDAVVGFVALAFIVAIAAEAVGLPITLSTAFVVALLIRRAAGMDLLRARAHVALLLIGTLLVVVITAVTAQTAESLPLDGWIA